MRPYLFSVVQYFISQLWCRVKHKVVGVLVLETYWGSGAIVPLSLISSELDGDEWLTSRSVQCIPGKGPRYPLNRKLRGLWACQDVLEWRKISRLLLGLEPRTVRTVPSLVWCAHPGMSFLQLILRSFPLGESYFSVRGLDLMFSATFVQQMRNVC
jgi:hypothetical protein